MKTLAEFMIIADADNHPPMLEKSLYDSWKSRMELYIENRENEIMILNSVQNGPLVWPTVVEEDDTTRTKRYEELSVVEKLQTDCDLKATNIVLQGLPPDMYAIATIQDDRVTMQQVQGRQGQSYVGTSYKGNATSSGGNNTGGQTRVIQAAQTTIPNTVAFQTEDLDAYDSDCDDVSNAKAVLTAKLSNYGSDVISEVPYFEPYHIDMDNQNVHAMQGFEQTSVVDFTDNEINIDNNIIPYSQYLQEMQQEVVQDTTLYAQQDSMILSVIEQMSEQMINHVNNWEKANQEKNNESLTAELERYKERVKTFEQRLNTDLRKREKMIDSQMDDMIKEKLALKQQIDSLEQIFLIKSKKRNLYCRHLLFFKTNPKKRKRIKPTLYDGSVISSQHAASPMIDDEETLILDEVSQSKMLVKQNDPMLKENKVNTTLINYVELNRLSKYFGKRFVPQQELFDEQAFWLQTSHPNTDQSVSSSVKIEAPKELPKVSLVNTSLKKLKYHLGQFDIVVKKHITPDAIIEKEWGFEHTKAIFLKEIIPFLKTLTDIFNVFDKDILNEKELFLENDLLLHQIMSQDVMIFMMNSTAVFDDVNVEMHRKYFKNNDLKAQLQAKDITICKLKEHIKSMRENDKEEKVKHDMDEIETINIKLEHSVAKLLSENKRLLKEIEHLKKIYKDQFDSIKKTRALSKEHYHSLIAQLNSKSMENADLKGQIQEKVLVTTALQNELRRLKGKHVLDNAITIAPGMFKLDIKPISHRLKNNRDAHEDYVKKTIENTNTIRGLVECARKQNPSKPLLDSACKFTKNVQELLVYVSHTCSSFTKSSEKLVESSSNLSHPRATFINRSQPTSNKKNARILQTPSSNMKNKVEVQRSNATDVPFSSSRVNDSKFLGIVLFGNDQIAKIMVYGDYQLGNVIVSRVYFVEGLGHNLFSVGQFCDADLEVAVQKNTCFIRNLEGVD
ncbi:hypothetical protein Tco_0228287 [Tanacetum coccineum]